MIQCETCKYRGDLRKTGYAGDRCTNKNAIFYKCPTAALVKRIDTPCKKYKEKDTDDSDNTNNIYLC